MLVVGSWVTSVIRAAAVQNSAVSAAHFVENFISPVGQELALGNELSEPARQALLEIFARNSLRERVVSYKIWLPEGLVVQSSNPEIIGQSFTPGEHFREALSGRVAASFEWLDSPENEAEAQLDVPLLEVYMPLREVWTDEIIGVVEFYERADQLRTDLLRAQLSSWAIVGVTFLISGVLLFGIVQAGGHKIRRQSEMLRTQLDLTRRISEQNAELQRKSITASARETAKSERMMRRLGADLHDGPAQYLSLAALRLDAALGDDPERQDSKEEIRQSLNRAMTEIRLLSRGLSLPDLDSQDLGTVVTRAVASHRQSSGADVDLTLELDALPRLGYAQKLCVYRFLQEAFSNAARHAPNARIRVTCRPVGPMLEVVLSDDGPGFDPAVALRLRAEGGQGLLGLVDRLESIGGTMTIGSVPGQGTTLSIRVPTEEAET